MTVAALAGVADELAVRLMVQDEGGAVGKHAW